MLTFGKQVENDAQFGNQKQYGQEEARTDPQRCLYPPETTAIRAYFELYGQCDQFEGIDEDQRDVSEWNFFCNWIKSRGDFYDTSYGDFSGIGGHEHEVVLLDGCYLKRTRPGMAGYIYDVDTNQIIPALVSEYLFRLAWQDFFFGTETVILGLVEVQPYKYSILTRQKEVVGRTPSACELEDSIERLGFSLVSRMSSGDIRRGGALYQFEDMFYIADVRADNCLVFSCGNGDLCMTPWDFFIAPASKQAKEFMTWLMQN